ncbi:MFS transporter [Actinophytocola algeriensis]|uniref:Putative MFS family arabinose efflux permease n=1 Tax=Actinophytocola algeriensis TaxID=1768010 RepID=A0A7W7Q537_9PSEU|nr:MFS transporter [Actinophytocola algeriensis]MBB4907232.1 putative MFS family arabinose efflux permease [Actinophytocola algeriensis]MBE1478715.1 putative MFS family arabinose efflux permease [Actinophytocola algeriensis]
MSERATFRQVLAVPVYRTVFLTRALAIGADTLRTVALSVLVFTATGSALLGAVTFGASFLPQVVGGLVIGALPDLVRPRLLIVTGYTLEAGAAAVLAVGGMPVWASLLLVAGIGCLAPVFNGTAGRLTADVLTGDAFVVGRGLFQLASSAAQVIGMAGGGLAVAFVGSETALLVTASCHAVAALWAWLALPDLPAPGRQSERSLVRQSFHGARELLVDPVVRRLLFANWLPPALVIGGESLLIPYAALAGFPTGAAGVVLACIPAGMFVGNLVVTRVFTPHLRERAVPVLVAVLGLPLVAFVFDLNAVTAGVLMVFLGAGFAFGVGLQGRFRDALPDDSTGQAFGLLSTGLMTFQGVGPLVFGGLTEVVPVGVAMALAGAATLGSAVWIALAVRPAEAKSPVPA